MRRDLLVKHREWKFDQGRYRIKSIKDIQQMHRHDPAFYFLTP